MTIFVSQNAAINGTTDADILVGVEAAGSATNDIIDGGAGNDVIFGSSQQVWVDTIPNNSDIANAISIEASAYWSTGFNPDLGNSATPHTTIIGQGTGNFDYYSVTVGAGQTITLDIDYGSSVAGYGGANFDTEIKLVDAGNVVLASNDDEMVTLGGNGSHSATDSYLTYTNNTGSTQTYYIRVEQYNDSVIASGGTYMLNVSLTGHLNTGNFTADNDTLIGGAGADILYGNAGNDIIDPGLDDDYADAGAGNDTVRYSGFAPVSGSIGVTVNLTQQGIAQNTNGAGFDTLLGFENILGSAFGDTLTGDGNNNIIEGGLGDDVLDGGAGTGDILSYAGFVATSGNTGVTVSLANAAAQNTGAGTDTLSNFEGLTGSAFNDTLLGHTGAEVLRGGNGNDRLAGFAGVDQLYGDAGNDDFQLFAAESNDVGEILDGGADFDDITIGAPATYNFRDDTVVNFEQLYFASGNGAGATVLFNASQFTQFTSLTAEAHASVAQAIIIDLAMDTASVLNLSTLDVSTLNNALDRFIITGDSDIETITGSAIADVISGNGGGDSLSGGLGNDNIDGGSENDVIEGGLGDDVLNGGDGTYDVLNYLGFVATSGTTGVTVSLANAAAQNTGEGTDTISNFEVLNGSNYDDTLTGLLNVADRLAGAGGNDILRGNGGLDQLLGGNGNDTLYSGHGNSVSSGGILDGGADIDTLVSTMTYSTSFSYTNLTLIDLEILNLAPSAGVSGNFTFSASQFTQFTTVNADAHAGQFVRIALTMGSLTTLDLSMLAVNGFLAGFNDRFLIIGDTDGETITGSSVTDYITSGDSAAVDTLNGSGGNDQLTIDGNGDVANGGEGDDTIIMTSALTGTAVSTINGGNGVVDVFRYTALATADYQVNLAAGTWIATATSALIGNLSGIEGVEAGGGADILTGDGQVNLLSGGGGADVLDGGTGADVLIGGDGADTFLIDNVGDAITEGAGGASGYDVAIISAVSYTLSDNIEQAVATFGCTTMTGSAQANYLYGGSSGLSLTLNGMDGDDILYSGLAGGNTLTGGAGVDTLLIYGGSNNANGGLGSDIYYTYTATDVISEAGGDGIDTVYASYSITLATGLEQLVLYGAATSATCGADNNIIYAYNTVGDVTIDAGGGSDVIFGGAGNDSLTGGVGVDLFFGGGGTNTLTGGDDTDIYYFEAGTSTVIETSTGGFDTVYSILAGTTVLAENVEQLILYGASSGGTGSSGDDYIYANTATNNMTLNGGGGNDYMLGSAQTDTFIGGLGSDQFDLAIGGNDTMRYNVAGNMGNDIAYAFDADAAGGQDLIDLSGMGYNAGAIGGAITITALGGGNTLITFDAFVGSLAGTTIFLAGVAVANVNATDFIF